MYNSVVVNTKSGESIETPVFLKMNPLDVISYLKNDYNLCQTETLIFNFMTNNKINSLSQYSLCR